MRAYLKSKTDFSTYKAVDVLEEDIVLHSTDDAQSSATLMGALDLQLGDYLVYGDWLGVLQDSEPGVGETSVKLSPFLSIFDREILYTDTSPASIEAFLKTVIDDNFTNQPDAEYRIPYIEVTAATSTPFIAPEMDEDEQLYSVYEYINYVRSLKGVYVDVAFDNDSINITIEHRSPVSHNIIFGSMGYELVSENYSNKVTSKVTAIANGVATDYYLMDDGTTTTDPNAGTRVLGEWQTFVINQSESELQKEDAAEKLAEKVSDKVASIFAKNSRSHCIEFLGTRKLGFGDTLLFKMHGKIFTSSVSQIIKASGDSRYRYKSGELKVTLTEKLTEVLK